MKKSLCILLTIALLFGNAMTTNAASVNPNETVEYLEDGSYLVTTIDVVPNNPLISTFATSSTCSGTKTVTYKSSSGSSLWSVAVNGSFSYVKGSSSTCTSSSISTTLYSSSWKISNKSSSKSGNKASATATGTQYIGSTVAGSITKTVTLTCSVNGTLS